MTILQSAKRRPNWFKDLLRDLRKGKYLKELERVKELAGLKEDSSDISVDGLISFIGHVGNALADRDIEALEGMKGEMDSVFSDSGDSLVQTKGYLIDNAVSVLTDLKAVERGGE